MNIKTRAQTWSILQGEASLHISRLTCGWGQGGGKARHNGRSKKATISLATWQLRTSIWDFGIHFLQACRTSCLEGIHWFVYTYYGLVYATMKKICSKIVKENQKNFLKKWNNV
jgi:hypothetical protein